MKLKTAILGGLLALFGASHASAQTDATVGGTTYKVYDVTGATAFRSGMNLALQTMLGGAGTTKVGFVGTVSTFDGADFTIYQGTFGGNPAIVRCSQSGSAEGVRDVSGSIAIPYIAINADVLASLSTTPFKLSNTTTIPATANLNGNSAATLLDSTVVPRFAFSDVAQSITPNPTPALSGGTPVGVICFAFMTNQGTTGITNITDQTFEQLYTKGKVQKSVFTGNPADTQAVLAMGRNNLSGTRILVLAETKYGPFKPCRQFGNNVAANAAITGTVPSATVSVLKEINSTAGEGFTSGSGLRAYMNASSASVTVDDVASQNVALVAYAGIPDVNSVANSANLATTSNAGKVAQMLTYNGVGYSYDNVRTGRYTLWSFERLYGPVSPTAAEDTFRTTLATGINTTLPSTAPAITGIRLADMLVDRPGGDGEVVTVP